MEAPAGSFVEESGRIVGVRLRTAGRFAPTWPSPPTGARRWSARLACCRSKRSARRWTCSGSACPRPTTPAMRCADRSQTGRMVVLIDRAHLLASAPSSSPRAPPRKSRRAGMEWLRAEVRRGLSGHRPVGRFLTSTDELHLLEVALDRLDQLVTGPACWRSAMRPMPCRRSAASASTSRSRTRSRRPTISPGRLARGEPVDALLHKVQERRLLPTRMIQAGQRAAQDRIIGARAQQSPDHQRAAHRPDARPLPACCAGFRADYRPRRPARAAALARRLCQS